MRVEVKNFGGVGAFMQRFPRHLRPNTEYVLTYYMKTRDLVGDPGVPASPIAGAGCEVYISALPDGWKYDAAAQINGVGQVQWSKEQSHSGSCALRLLDSDISKARPQAAQAQRLPVEAGKRYVIGGWIKYAKDTKAGGVVLTSWYYPLGGGFVPAPEGGEYGNYKTQIGNVPPGGETPWTFIATTYVNVFDPKTKTNHALPEHKLASETARAFVELAGINGPMTVLVDDVEFRELPAGDPYSVWTVGVEKRP